MIIKFTRNILVVCGLALVLGGNSVSAAAISSVNFTGRSSSPNVQADFLKIESGASSTGVAGLNGNDQWNDILTNQPGNTPYTNSATVIGSGGDASIDIQLTHGGSWSHSASNVRIVALEDPDGDLTDGGFEVNVGGVTVVASGLIDDFPAAYDVYLYFSSESLPNSASTWTVNNGSSQSVSALDIYDGSGLVLGQDYLVWSGVSGDTFTLRGNAPTGAQRHAVAGIEIVEAIPEPSTIVLAILGVGLIAIRRRRR